jgi:hypothetical protein
LSAGDAAGILREDRDALGQAGGGGEEQRGGHEAALGSVGGADARHDPIGAGDAVGEKFVGQRPPGVPAAAQEGVGGPVPGAAGGGGVGQERGAAHQQGIGADGIAGGFLAQTVEGEEAGEAAEGGLVGAVAEGGHDLLVEDLGGAAIEHGRLQQFGAAAQAAFAGGVEHRAALGRREARHGRAAGRGRGARGDGIGHEIDVVEREIGDGIERGAQGDLERAGGQFGGGQRAGIERDMRADATVARIVGMAVPLPVGGADVDFHVAGDPALFRPDQKHGIQEIGAGAGIPIPGVFDPHLFASACDQLARPQAVIRPHALQVAFGEGGGRGGGRLADAAGEQAFRGVADSAARGNQPEAMPDAEFMGF